MGLPEGGLAKRNGGVRPDQRKFRSIKPHEDPEVQRDTISGKGSKIQKYNKPH